MHRSTHAFLTCIAWYSLLCYGNAAKAPAPSEVLSHFARTVGSVLNPTLAHEIQKSRPTPATSQKQTSAPIRRQVDTRPETENDGGNDGSSAEVGVRQNNVVPFSNQRIPFQFDREINYRYPGFGQLSQNFFPGAAGAGFNNQLLANGVPIDARYFQRPISTQQQLAPIRAEIPKALSANINSNIKESGTGNPNSIQNIDGNSDTKTSAQNRPFDTADFSNGPGGPGQGGGGGFDPSGGGRYSGIEYDRVRQNYYNDPGINQQQYYQSFNEIPFSGGYRSAYANRFSGLDYNGGGAGRPGLNSDYRQGGGFGGISDPYNQYPGYYQNQYQSQYQNLPGGIGAGGDGGFNDGGFERGGNYGSLSGRFSYPGGGINQGGGFGSGFYPVDGQRFGPDGDSSLRASSAKQTVTSTDDDRSEELEDRGDEEREEEKIRFVDVERKQASNEEKKKRSSKD